MTLLDALGLYVGWDDAGSLWFCRTYEGSLQLQLGRILLGCDWFFRKPNARNIKSTTQTDNR